jgi:lactate dehydrogenase-like 2-hydroxyacid dehydrogenase
VSLHVPGGPQTHHLVGSAELALMKPTAVLVNTSRGPVVEEAALVEALRERRIFAAALDVFEHEPRVSQALRELDNVVLAPHIASASGRTRSRMS